MFQDESRFGRITDPKRCWAARGVRPIVKKQMIREYTYAYGAFSPLDGISDMLILPNMTSHAMNIFLKELSNRHKDEIILLFLDQASCHGKRVIKKPRNIMIEYLPPYSPELNCSENVWDDMKEKFFSNKVFNSMNAVEDKLIEACLFYEKHPELVKSITGFHWIIEAIEKLYIDR
jgi:transposase